MVELASKPADKNVNDARPTSSDSSSKDYIKYIYIFLQQIIPSPNLIFVFFSWHANPACSFMHPWHLFYFFIISSSSSFNVFVSPTVLPLDCVVVCSSCCLAPIGASLFLRSFDREDCLDAYFRVDQRYISKLHPSIHLRLEREAGCVVYRRSQENTVSLFLPYFDALVVPDPLVCLFLLTCVCSCYN